MTGTPERQRARPAGTEPARNRARANGGNHLWAIVLAGGNGTRVSGMTLSSARASVPKQYWGPPGGEAMVRWALHRARRVVPSERVVVVVAEQHRGFWERELADVPPANIVVQPRNRGTAAGVLLPLLSIVLRRDPMARVLILPSDHYVADEIALKGALVDAVWSTQPSDRPVLLLGMTPSIFDPEYGWMVPDPAGRRGPRAICRFVEKPDRDTAAELMRGGALLNAFIFVAQAEALLLIFERTLPRMLGMLRRCVRAGMQRERLEQVYEELPAADFSRDVLERSTESLSVAPVPSCGWSDLGTPARIQLYLSQQGQRTDGGSCG